jgi:A/G-specific adenine glycosylase
VALREALLRWYRACRRDLPWRRTTDPYAIWVSEIMLQQTRVDTVVPYYERFLAALPSVQALAEAPLDRILELWSGLGYYRRARLLHRGAQDVCANHRGVLPSQPNELTTIAGIGRYTAGAIASIAHGVPAPVVDGNVARVLSRLEAWRDDPASVRGKKRLWSLAETLARCTAPGDLNQALMELGATLCTPHSPACDRCPVTTFCKARAAGIERELPRVTKKKATPIVAMRAFVIDTGDRLVCGKRAPQSLYGGMWEPPMFEGRPRSLFGIAASRFEARGSFTHVLTHRRLEVEVLYARVRRVVPKQRAPYERIELLGDEDVARRAMSRLARRVLAMALETTQNGRSLHFRSL